MANSASQPRSVRLGADGPIGVPIEVESAPRATLAALPFAGHLTVVLDSERIGAEDERVLSVVERIEEDLNRVGLGELGVAAALADDNPVRLGVEIDDADVKVLPIEDESDFGSLGGWLPLVRLLLDERAERLGARPARLVHAAVDHGAVAFRQVADRQFGHVRRRPEPK